MDRRLINFFVASAVFLTIYMSLNAMFGPPPDVVQADRGGERQGGSEAAEGTANSSVGDTESTLRASTEREAVMADAARQLQEQPDLWTTLGSMDPTSGYRMLVTLRSRGGAIERIELTERNADGRLKYRRVDVRSGYLGYLAPSLSAVADGVVVNVVGPGTPAALAKALGDSQPGLQVGDRIVAADGSAIQTRADLESVLSKTQPGDALQLEVERPAAVSEDEIANADESVGEMLRLRFEAELTEHPLDLVRLASTGGEDQIVGNLNRASCLLTLAQVAETSIRTGQRELPALLSQHNTPWELKRKSDSVEFRLPLPAAVMEQVGGQGGVELARSYQLLPESYTLDMEVAVRNNASTPQRLAYRLEGVNGVTLEGWWYSTKISPNFSGAGARDLVYNSDGLGRQLVSATTILGTTRDEPQSPDDVIFAADSSVEERALEYIGIDAQYFSVAYVPPKGESVFGQYTRAAGMLVADPIAIPNDQERAANISYYLDSAAEMLAPGEEIRHRLTMFAGPKQPALLVEYGLSETLEYGWFWWVAKPLSGVLHLFNAIVGNYALAIFMLTVLVRGCMFPLSRKAAVHAQKMQELAPELKKVAEKYKDDFEKRLQAQRELQQKAGFNPLSGCLPMFVQLPIFMGLYRALSVDIELRQAALSSKLQWASNLAAPDMLYYWGDFLWGYLAGRGTGWLGPYFNILPIVVVLLFLVQQKMFMPPATDEQTAMTQKVMTVMTMFMGLFFFRVPSGLCIYFITSSLWGIVERKAVKKMVPNTPQLNLGAAGDTVDGTVLSTKSSTVGRSKTIADRLKEAAGMTETKRPVTPPNKRKRPPTKKK